MLTPVEIQNKEFRRGWRGYRDQEVKAFMEQIVQSYQELYQENQELKDQLFKLEQALKKYQEWEQTIKDALVVAQKSAEEVRRQAEKEAELIKKEAQLKAEEILAGARAEVEKLSRQYDALAERINTFKRRWQAVLQAELEAMERLEVEPFSGSVGPVEPPPAP